MPTFTFLLGTGGEVKMLTVRNANALLVNLGMLGAVLPALAIHVLSTVFLIVASPQQWLAYVLGWWGLVSLLRLFSSFFHKDVEIGPITVLGLLAASVTVIALVWPVITRTPPCATCRPPDILVYRPDVLCVAVATHWLFLHFRGFRLCRPSTK